MSKPKILLTNDDGINGEGLNCLLNTLKAVADVYVLCPDVNKSAVSSCLSLDGPMLVRQISDGVYTLSANPVDCVITALKSDLFDVSFDAVISGINKGANLGTDIIYSGTVAAARQAVLYGVPGIAVSLESFDNTWEYEELADFVKKNLMKLVTLSNNGRFVNVNALSGGHYKEACMTTLCTREYNDRIKFIKAPNNKLYGFYTSGKLDSTGESTNDFSCIAERKISVSQVYAECTCHNDAGDFII